MGQSLRSAALAALFILPYATTASEYQEVEAGPNALDECVSCPYLYTNFYRCQKIAQPGRVGDEVKKCICIPHNDDHPDKNGWYPYIDTCRGCLIGMISDDGADFWSSMAGMTTAIYQSCPSGNITSDGSSLCATTSKSESCMSLRDSSEGETWVSHRGLNDGLNGKYDTNRTQLLNLAEVKANLTTSITAKTTATTAATGSDSTASTTTPPTGTDSQDPSSTAGSQSTTTTTGSGSLAARLSQGSQAGYVLGMLAVAGIVGGLI